VTTRSFRLAERAVRAAVGTVAAVALGLSSAGCARLAGAAPACVASQSLALAAQSVPSASFVPCIEQLASGWKSTSFKAVNGHSRFVLVPSAAGGGPVPVELLPGCDIAGAPPTTPRAPGVRTYRRLESITPRYRGTLYDVFPGGCVTYHFDFVRGPHIALTEDFETSVALMSRTELRFALHKNLGLTLDQ
jgi:hypothetical protein